MLTANAFPSVQHGGFAIVQSAGSDANPTVRIQKSMEELTKTLKYGNIHLRRWAEIEGNTILWFDPEIGTPMVSMAEYGLTFNRAAVEALGKPWKVRLGFDNLHKKIVIKPVGRASDEEEKASGLPFAERERDGYVRISNKDFIRFVVRYCPESNLRKSVRFAAIWDEDEGLMEVDINRPVDPPEEQYRNGE